jgi:hypothetical protein
VQGLDWTGLETGPALGVPPDTQAATQMSVAPAIRKMGSGLSILLLLINLTIADGAFSALSPRFRPRKQPLKDYDYSNNLDRR